MISMAASTKYTMKNTDVALTDMRLCRIATSITCFFFAVAAQSLSARLLRSGCTLTVP